MNSCLKLSILLFVCVISFGKLSAQSNRGSISGRVMDSEAPLEFVNVVMLDYDSTFIKGATTDGTGAFILTAAPYGKAILRISLMGYQSAYLNVDVDSPTTDIGEFKLAQSSQTLGEVKIKASLPQFRIKNGVLITNVDRTLLSSIGTASEVLNQIPGITSKEEDGINVFGKGAPLIYINNRKVYDIKELNQLQSSDILTVELIKNPGAKYNASDKAVIIIKTKSRASGFSASLYERVKFGRDVGDTEMIDLSYANKKLNAYLSYYHGYMKNRTTQKNSYDIYTNPKWSQSHDLIYFYNLISHGATASLDYSFTKDQSIGVQYKGDFYIIRYNPNSKGDIFKDDILQENIVTKTRQKESPKTHLVNVFYSGKFNERTEIKFDMDYVGKRSATRQFTDERSSIPQNDRTLDINSDSDFELWVGKLTGGYSIKENSKIELGAEYSVIRGKGHYLNSEDLSNSNIYTNDEDKFATFVSFQTAIQKWQMSLGVRYEYSKEKSTEGSAKTVKVNRHYNNVYPSFGLSRAFGKVDMSLNAGVRTRRPSFFELTGSDGYINRFLSQSGNPFLKKEDHYEINYDLSYKILTFGVGYSYVKNPIDIDFIEDGSSTGNSILTFKNYKKYQSLNFMASTNYTIGFWNPQLTIGLSQPFLLSTYREETLKRNKTNYNIDFTNNFTLPKNYTISIYYTYKNDYDQRFTRWSGYHEIDLLLRKSFLEKRLSLTLYVNDVFNLIKDKSNTYVDNYDLVVIRKRENQYINFTIRYLFNNTQKKYKGRGTSSGDINRL